MGSTPPVPLFTAPSKITGISYYGTQLYYTSGSCMYSYSTGVSTIVAGIRSLSAQTADGAYPTTTGLVSTVAFCTDMNGNRYIVDKSGSDNTKSVIVKMPTYTPLQAGLTYNLAGTNACDSGVNTCVGTFTNNQPAYSETFGAIKGMCYDSVGNLYVCDAAQHIVARMGATGTMSVYAGTLGQAGSSGDGAIATSAKLSSPSDIKMSRGNILYIADTGNNKIRRVKMVGTTGIIETMNFTGFTILSPKCLAFDANENLYVVGSSGGNTIYRISNFGIATSEYTASPTSPITSITVDRATNTLYFSTPTNVWKLVTGTPVLVLSGLTAANGLAIDSTNILYVSDSTTNKVFRAPLNPPVSAMNISSMNAYIGNGEQEPSFSITSSVTPNIYGNAGPPTTRALTSPGAIVVNPSQGILVAQPTKVTLLATTSAAELPSCANKISHISIRNISIMETMYLSQIVALNSSGVNVLLRNPTGVNSAYASYTDGTYACKSKDIAYAILPKMTLTIPISPPDDIVIVLLYPSSTNKANWNGATIRTAPFPVGSSNNPVRIIQGVSESPAIKNFVIDYRTKSATCAPYINFMNKYKLQSSVASPIDTSYREKWVRYVRISPTATTGTPQISGLTRVYVIDGETGEDRILGKVPNISMNVRNSTDTQYGDAYVVNRKNNLEALTKPDSGTSFSNFPTKSGAAYLTPVTISDVWLEYDLMDEYPIERMIIEPASAATKVTFFTSSRAVVENPTASISFSGAIPSYTSSWSPSPRLLSPVVTTTTRGIRYIRLANGSAPTNSIGTLTLSALSTLPTGLTNLALDTAGNVYAVNTQAVYKINTAGAITGVFNVGSITPSGLALDNTGNVYLTDSGSDLIQKVEALEAGSLQILLRAKNYTSGTTWTDDSGRGRNASIFRTVAGTVLKNASGNGIVMNGTTWGSFPNVGVGNSWSMGVWYKSTILPSVPVGEAASLITQEHSGGGIINMYLGYNPTNTAITASFLSSAGWANSPHTITLARDEWVNIQVTWDGTNFIIYVNGNMHGTIYRPGFASVDNGNAYRFGRKWDNTSGVCIQGEMGEIRIYNTPLTSSQVKSIYNESAADFGYVSSRSQGFIDGIATNTKFDSPRGTIFDANGNTYVADTGNNAIRMINPYGITRTLVSSGLTTPRGVAINNATNTLYITDTNAVRSATVNTDLYSVYTLFSGLMPSSLPTPPTSLQVLLRAKNYSGTGSWTDESNNGKHATMVAGGVNQKNAAGNGIVLNGSTYWTFPALPAVGNSWTANVWFKQTGTNVGASSGTPCILTQQYNSASGNDMNIGIRAFGPPSTTYQGWIYKYPQAWPTINQNTTLQMGVWTNIQITWSGTVMTTYVNGISIGSTTISLSSPLGSQNIPYNIGKRWDTNADPGNQFVRGEIGEVRIYNTALTDAEVLAAYNQSLSDFSNPQSTCIDPTTGDLYIADTGTVSKMTGITRTLPVNTMTGTVQNVPIGMPGTNGPYALTVTPTGTLIVTSNNRIRRIVTDSANDLTTVRLPLSSSMPLAIGSVTTLPGTYSSPLYITFDPAGNLYVSGHNEHRIYRFALPSAPPAPTVLAGSGSATFADGTGTNASFFRPCGLAIDANNNLFVAEHGNHRIRKIHTVGGTVGMVTNVAGSGALGFADGIGTAAQLNHPVGLVFDSLGNLFFSEHGSHRIRMMAPNGNVTTIAGPATATGASGYVDGVGTTARFIHPTGLAFDSFGNLYIADFTNHRIRMITAATVRTTNGGVVTTFAGSGTAAFADGRGTSASFNNPGGICIDVNNNIYVGEENNRRIRMITPSGVVTTIAGNGTAASVDGVGINAQFNQPYGLAIDPTGQFLCVGGGTSASTIRRITIGSIIGWGIATYLGNIVSPVVDTNGCTYMVTKAQGNGHYIYKTTPGGFTYQIAGWNSTGTPVYTNASTYANLTCYKKISSIAVTASGDIYVAETDNHCIRVLRPILGAYAIWTYVGNRTVFPSPVNLVSPRNVTIDPDYNLYVIDGGNSCIRKISANGSTSTLLTGLNSFGITYDKTRRLLFVTELSNHCVSSIDPTTGIKTVIAGLSGTLGNTDGTGTAARFKSPAGIAVDTQGNLYVVDQGNNTIRRLTQSGSTWTTTTIVGSAAVTNVNLDGVGTAARLWNPYQIAVATNGDLYVACDSGDYTAASISRCIKKITSGSWVVSTYFTFSGSMTGNASNDLRASGLTVDSLNNLFVSAVGSNGHYVYRITNRQDGYVIAGNTTTLGDGYSGGINLPYGLCLDPYGNIFVADHSNNSIRILVPRYMSHVLAGNGTSAFADGAGTVARFNGPNSIALDRSGNLIVADTGNHRIRKVTPAGIVTTIGGTGTATSTGDSGQATSATFNAPTSVSVDWSGAMYVTENSSKIRVLYPQYDVNLVAGSVSVAANLQILLRAKNYTSGTTWRDESDKGRNASLGGGIAAKNGSGNGIVLNGSTFWTFPNVAVGNSWSIGVWYKKTGAIPADTAPAIVTQQYIGTSVNLMLGYFNAPNLSMSYHGPWYTSPNTITLVDNQWTNIQVTWDGTNLATYVNGNILGTAQPGFTMADANSSYFIGRRWDALHYVTGEIGEVRIYNTPLTSSQVKSVHDESASDFGPTTATASGVNPDGIGAAASFNTPTQIAWDNANQVVYVADTGNKRVRRVAPSGSVTTVYTSVNALGGITVDPSGLVYALDGGTTIRTIRPNPLTVNQIVALDSNGINVAYKKPIKTFSNPQLAFRAVSGSDATPYISAGATSTEYLEIDLQQDYEITQVTYVGADAASGTQLLLYDAALRQQDSRTVSGSLQTVDFRYAASGTTMKFAPLLLTDSSKYMPDSTLAGYVRGQYIVFENNTVANKTITPPVIYDIYGKRLGTGLTTADSTALTTYGSKWELDLGQEYCIRDIQNTNNASIAIYNREKAEIWRNYTTNTLITAPFLPQIPITTAASSYPVRFVRISVTPAGMVTTMSLTPYTTFNQSQYLTVDPAGNIYVSEWGGHKINKVTPGGVVSLLAGSGTGGFVNGVGSAAQFRNPCGLAIRGEFLYVADQGNHRIRRIRTSGTGTIGDVTTINGMANGWATGLQVLLRAKTYSGTGSWLDESGNSQHATLAAGTNAKNAAGNGIVLNGSTYWTIPALTMGTSWTANVWYKQTAASPSTAYPSILTHQFVAPHRDINISINANGSNVFRGQIFKFNPSYWYYSSQNTTLVNGRWTNIQITWNGSSMVTYVNGVQTGTTSLSLVSALGTNTQLLNIGKRHDLAEYVTGEIGEVRIYNRALMSTEVLTAYNESAIDFINNPVGLAFDSTGNLFFSEHADGHRIKMLNISTNVVTTIAGSGTATFADGFGVSASFNYPTGIAFDSAGNLYIADQVNHRIRMITVATVRTTNGGVVSTFAGSGTAAFTDATGASAQFSSPSGLCIDTNNNLYIGDQMNHRVRMITPAGAVTTLAGNGTAASVDGVGPNAQINRAYGVALDPTGQFIYVSQYVPGGSLRKVVIPYTVPPINHVSVIDNRGVDVAVWKIVRKVTGTAVTFDAFNGTYSRPITITTGASDRIEIDLGLAYNVTRIVVYYAGISVPVATNVITYSATGVQIIGVPVTITNTVNAITTYKSNGLRARYLNVYVPSGSANIHNMAVIDSLGRNVYTSTAAGNVYVTNMPSFGQVKTEIDLGREYNILYVVIYNKYTGSVSTILNPTVETTLTGASIEFLDAYRNTMTTRQILGTAGLVYPIGTPISDSYVTPNSNSGIVVTPGTPPTWAFSYTEKVVVTYDSATQSGSSEDEKQIRGITGYVDSAGKKVIFFTINQHIYKLYDGSLTPVYYTVSGGLRGIAISADRSTLYVCNSSTNTIGSLTATSSATWTTIAGGGNATRGSGCGLNSVDGSFTRTATQCTFNNPTGIAIDSSDNLYVADTNNHLIRKLVKSGTTWTVSTYAGGTRCYGVAGEDGNRRDWIADWESCAEGRWRSGYDLNAAGRWCTVDTNYRDIAIISGADNGQSTAARFNSPKGISMGSDGKLYVADTGNSMVRVIDSSQNVTTLITGTNSLIHVTNFSGDVYFSRSNTQLFVRGSTGVESIWSEYGTSYRASGSTANTDGFLVRSLPSDVPPPSATCPPPSPSVSCWTAPGTTAGSIEVGLPSMSPAGTVQGNIGNIGPFIFLGGTLIFVETFIVTAAGSTTYMYKIRRTYDKTSVNITGLIAPSQSTTGPNTYAHSSTNYFIPDRPFIGPFTASVISPATNSNAPSAIINNTFIAQITTEVIDVSMPPPVTGLYFVSISSTSIAIGWTSGGDSNASYTFTLNGVRATPIVSGMTATFNNLTPDTLLYTIDVYTSNTNGPSFPATITSYPDTTAPQLSVVTATSGSITVQWTGGDFTNYYTYTLNAQSLIPTVDNSKTNKTVIFTRDTTNTRLTGNTTYYINVISNRNTGRNFSSPMLIVTTAPVIPVLSFTSINQTLSWSGGDGATSYQIMCNEVDVTSKATIDGVGKTIRFTGTNTLLGNTTYTFVVTATSANGSSESDPLTITTPPVAVVLTVSSISANSVTVSWTGGDGASSYRFFLYLNSGSNTAYPNPFGKIQGVNVAGEGGIIDVTTVAFCPTPVFLAQDGATVRAISTGSTNPRYFLGAMGNFRYDLYIAVLSSSPYSADTGTTFIAALSGFPEPYPLITQTGSSITITNMIANSKYTIGVIAINNNGETLATADNVKTDGTFNPTYLAPPTMNVPTSIGSLTTSNITQSTCKITYTGGDTATSLTINITLSGAPVSGGYGSLYTYNVFSRQIAFFILNSSKTYVVTVRATNSAGTSTPSTTNITTSGLTLTITTSSITYNSATIQWTPVPGASSYKYTYNSNPDTTCTNPFTISSLTAATTYTITVKAYDSSNVQIGIGNTTFLTGPVMPNVSQSATKAPTSITVNWSNPPSTTDYPTSGYVFTLNGAPITPTISGTSATFSSLAPGSSYTVTMKYSSTGNTGTLNAYTSPVQPTINASNISNITDNSFTISWTACAGAASYRINYGSGLFTNVNSATTTQIISSLSSNTSYSVNVVAISSNSVENPSATTSVLTAPVAPTNLVVSSYTNSYGCTLTWTCPGGAASYNISGFKTAITGVTSPYIVTGQDAGVTYNDVRVTAINATASVASLPISVRMIPGPIAAIAAPAAGVITQTGFPLSWGIVTGAGLGTPNAYEYSLNGGSSWTGTTSNGATITGQAAGTTITVRVRALNSSGVSAATDVSVLLKPATPTASASGWTLTGFNVSYTGVGATNWKVTVNGTDVSGWITDKPYTASYPGLTDYATTTFTVCVTIKNASGESPASATVTGYKPPQPWTLSIENRMGISFYPNLRFSPSMFATTHKFYRTDRWDVELRPESYTKNTLYTNPSGVITLYESNTAGRCHRWVGGIATNAAGLSRSASNEVWFDSGNICYF